MHIFKHVILLTILMLCPIVTFGQEAKETWITETENQNANFFDIRDKYEQKFEKEQLTSPVRIHSKSKNIKVVGENDYIKFRRWEWYMNHIIHSDGTLPSSKELNQSFEEVVEMDAASFNKNAAATWNNISRTRNSGGYWGMGRTGGIGFHPTNANIFWVCADAGGIWKTTNGGASYTAQGDNLPYLGSGSIVVDYSNGNTIYIATGNNSGGNGAGIYKSTNGGSNWSATGFTRNLSNNVKFYNLTQNPSNAATLLVATNQGIYITTNRGSDWSRVISGNATDVKYRIGDGNEVYATIDGKFYKSTNGGASFSRPSGSPDMQTRSRGELFVSKSNRNKILMWSSPGIWVSTDRGSSWSKKNKASEGGKTITFDAMAISPVNQNILYGGAVDMWRSDNNGNSWTRISKWHANNNPATPEVHADHRLLAYNPLNNRIYSCNDGGIDRYNESTKSWTELNNNLQIPQYYSAASAETNGNIIGVGSQDNGGSQRKSDGTWINTNGGDAGTQAIDPTDANICYSNYNPRPAIIRTTNGWRNTKDVKPNEELRSWWTIPYTLEPGKPQNIVVGYHAIYKSTNRGDSWRKISPDFAPRNDYWKAFRAIAVAPSNGNVIYAFRPGKFHYTYNNGGNWGSVDFSEDITDIAVDPSDSNIVYVTCSRYDKGQKVYKSTNGGKNWSNISGGIPNIPVYSIVYQKDSDELLYVGTQLGVFYKNKSMNEWKVYGNGLPKTMVRDLHINYDKKKLRAATYGRGIYETELATNTGGSVACRAPQNVKVTGTQDRSVSLSWDGIAGAKQYYVYHKSAGTDWKYTAANKNTSITISGLASNTNYTFDVWVQCANDEYKSTRVTAQTRSSSNNSIQDGAVYQIVSVFPGKRVLDVYQIARKNGANVIIYRNNKSQNQYWQFVRSSSGNYVLVPQHDTGRALDVNRSLNENGTNVQTWARNNTKAQEWKVTNVGNNEYTFESAAAPGLFLDINRGVDANLTNVQIWSGNNSNAQKWTLQLADTTKDIGNELSSYDTNVYPNPAVEKFTIDFKNNTDFQNGVVIELINTLGVVVKKMNNTSGDTLESMDVETGSLPTGAYILKIRNQGGEKIHTQQIIIRR